MSLSGRQFPPSGQVLPGFVVCQYSPPSWILDLSALANCLPDILRGHPDDERLIIGMLLFLVAALAASTHSELFNECYCASFERMSPNNSHFSPLNVDNCRDWSG